jgi:hypothetical protein
MKTFQQFAESLPKVGDSNFPNIDDQTQDGRDLRSAMKLSRIPAKLTSSSDGSYELEVLPGENVFDKINDAAKLISRGANMVTFVFNNKKMMITRENYISFMNNIIPQHFAVR